MEKHTHANGSLYKTFSSYNASENLNQTIHNLSNSSMIEDYDYMSTEDRAYVILSKPNNILALILGFFALVANIMALLAIIQIRRTLTSHLRILISLIASDLLVDVSLISHIINTVFHPQIQPGYGEWEERIKTRCSFIVIKAFNTAGLNITLLNLMALAIDHYIAILRPFQLGSLLSRRKTIGMIVILWLTALIAGFSDFLVITYNTNYHYCERIWLSDYQEEFVTFCIITVCFVSMLYMYLHIYCEVKGKHFSDTVNDIKAHRNKRALVTTLLILGTFILCWLPIFIFNIVLIIIVKTDVSEETMQRVLPVLTTIESYLYDLMLLNTLCDPIIYTIRMKEVQRGYYVMFCSPSRIHQSIRRQSNSSMAHFSSLRTTKQDIGEKTEMDRNKHVTKNGTKSINGSQELETLIETTEAL